MSLLRILGLARAKPDTLPEFIRELQDIRGVRVIRMHGTVGKEIGAQAEAVDLAAARSEGVFARPLLFDFSGTTGWDFATVSYMVLALRRRMAAHAQVGIVNPPPQLLAELEIAHVESLFRVFASEEEALAELSGPA
jgi:anti-anti-sigma regulatory factor